MIQSRTLPKTRGKTVILVPYRGEEGGHREAILRGAVLPHLGELAERTGAHIVVADSGHQPFSVGNSFNLAAQKADEGGRWAVALLHEADFIVSLDAAEEAINRAHDGHLGLIYAWTRHVRLSSRGTAKLLEGKREKFSAGSDFRLGSPSSPGGPRAVNRAMWHSIGGFHPGFVGWGYEDNHFLWKSERICRSSRVVGDLLNAWHPRRQDEPDDPYFAAQHGNLALWERLRAEGESDDAARYQS